MSKYFQNFPMIRYSFGSNEDSVLWQNQSVYIDLLDKIADDASFYHKYEILSGDRPDVVSYKLYGTVNHYWTFHLLNNHVRESGWPLSDAAAYDHVKLNYPNWTIVTENPIADTLFQPGATVEGSSSGSSGVIIARNLDLGQLVINSPSNFLANENIRAGLDLGNQDFVKVYSQSRQYDSVHHYEDTDGNYVDIDPFDQTSTNGLIPVTYTERVVLKNNQLKSIRVLRPDVVESVSREFQRLLKS